MKFYKQIIILIGFLMIVSVEGNLRYSYAKNYMRNAKKSFINICNKIALNETNNNDIYNCLIENNNNCENLENYSNFIKIRNNCITEINSTCGMTIIILILSWIIIGLLCH